MLNWIESRTGFVSMAKDFLVEDIPGGASYWYVFGSATIFAMILQIVTGIFLTFFYAPSANTAWESTAWIYTHYWPHLILSIHYWGASAMIALVFLHLLQVLVWGAYKSPRELQWVVGVILLLITLVLGLTGYLLPWDMNAYFASQVSLNITGTAPIAGSFIQQLAQGGGAMGTETINRFFGIHVWLMPAVMVALVGAHLAIFRWNGPAGPVTEDPRTLKNGRFWPDQMFMDGFASFIVFAIVVALALISPPFLDAKADPTNATFIPYPAWYFLSLFGLLNLVPPSLDLLATIIVPTLFLLLVLAVPWLDRSTTRSLAARGGIIFSTVVVLAVIVGLSLFSQISIQAKQAKAPPSPTEAQVLAAALATAAPTAVSPPTSSNAPPASGSVAASAANPLVAAGAPVFASSCAGCHGATGLGMPGAIPPLAGNPYVTGDANAVIGTVLTGLHSKIVVEGVSYNGQMPAWKGALSNKDIAAVISYIRGGLGKNTASAVSVAQVAAYKP
ncbi:MAG TPA: cytochrome b N-terminal domain-containing protein [Candidatus Dormibacteraeota bacterium]|nr:cytochrome b N-terminal domain-containing protein [Candidatus Dormibacteraeota bacterium]